MHRFLILLFLVFNFSSTAQTVEYWIYDTLHVTCFYATNRPVPDTVAYPIKSIDTLKTGSIVLYWDREKKYIYENRKVGRDTSITFYRNGQVNEMFWFSRDDQGQIDYDLPAHNRGWYPDGTLKLEDVMEGNTYSIIYYYHNGQIRKRDVLMRSDQATHSKIYQLVYTEMFCENGKVLMKDSIQAEGMHLMLRYYCNGVVAERYSVNHYFIFGKYETWYENGNRCVDGQYDAKPPDGDLQTFRNRKQGDWKCYDTSGKLMCTERYKDDKLIEVITY